MRGIMSERKQLQSYITVHQSVLVRLEVGSCFFDYDIFSVQTQFTRKRTKKLKEKDISHDRHVFTSFILDEI